MTRQNETGHTPWTDVPATGPILRPLAAAAYLGISLQTFYRRAADGAVPAPIKIGTHISGVPQPWLDALIADWAVA